MEKARAYLIVFIFYFSFFNLYYVFLKNELKKKSMQKKCIMNEHRRD